MHFLGEPDGSEGKAVDGAGAQASQALEVQPGPVAFVQVELVAGAEGIGVYHETVPGDFGGDGSGSD